MKTMNQKPPNDECMTKPFITNKLTIRVNHLLKQKGIGLFMSKLILLGESGSTKTDWVLISGSTKTQLTTIGLNPFIVDSATVIETIDEHDFFSDIKNSEISIHFYGSGCSTPERNTVISRGLELYFPKADVTIYHDIQAAVNATCNHTLGIVGILGTGSNYVRRWKKN